MRRTKSGLPKHCAWNADRHGKRRVRFRKSGFSTYITGTPWSEDFMRQYAAALDGGKRKNENGTGFSRQVFTKWFKQQCMLAGIFDRSGHGLRKSAPIRLANAGCTAHEIAAITGHRSLREVEHYTPIRSDWRGRPCGGWKQNANCPTYQLGWTKRAKSNDETTPKSSGFNPGWIETKNYAGLRQKDHRQHPAGRVGRPDDVAALVSWLLDAERSGFVTGANFVIDGGMTRKMIYEE